VSSVAPLHRTLEQELQSLLRGASLECLVCGEFVLHRGGMITCPECGKQTNAMMRFMAPPLLRKDEATMSLQAG